MSDQELETAPARELRRLAQAVTTLDEATPRIDLGDPGQLEQVEAELGHPLPPDLRTLYVDSNPVALTIPLPADDIEFIQLSEIIATRDDLDLPDGVVVFAQEGETPYAVRTDNPDSLFVAEGTQSSEGWSWEPVASSLADFMRALAEVTEAFASSRADDLASKFEVGTDEQISLEEKLSEIDEEYADRWLEWLA